MQAKSPRRTGTSCQTNMKGLILETNGIIS
jgi:hypothetical protein